MIGSSLMLSCQEAAWLYRAVILIRARKIFNTYQITLIIVIFYQYWE